MDVWAPSLVTDADLVEWMVADDTNVSTDVTDATDGETRPKRKRQRLDHLSNEEKLMRR